MWSPTMHDNQQHWIFGAVRNMVTAGNMGLSSCDNGSMGFHQPEWVLHQPERDI